MTTSAPSDVDTFLAQYPQHTAYLVAQALANNPAHLTEEQIRRQLYDFWDGLGDDEPMDDATFTRWLAALPPAAVAKAQRHYVNLDDTAANADWLHGQAGDGRSLSALHKAQDTVDGLTAVAAGIAHCGDYGVLFWHPARQSVWWTAADSDSEANGFDDPADVRAQFAAVPGVADVQVEHEVGPTGDGWLNLDYDRADVEKSRQDTIAVDPAVGGDGHWVTLDNGAHVYIDGTGAITAGPKFLMDKLGHPTMTPGQQQELMNNPQDATATLAYHLAALLPDTRRKTTIGAAVVEAPNGQRYMLLSTNESRDHGETPYVRPQVADVLQSDAAKDDMPAQWVFGRGHAEAKLVAYANKQNVKLITIGASNPVCRNCAKLLRGTGVDVVTPLKVYGARSRGLAH